MKIMYKKIHYDENVSGDTKEKSKEIVWCFTKVTLNIHG